MAIVLAGLVAACSPPQQEPRNFFFFMEDGLAREGVLARCNVDREAASRDIECANARRAAAAIGAYEQREQSSRLERASERKLLALRNRLESDLLRQQSADTAARVAAEQAYELQWKDPSAPHESPGVTLSPDEVPVFGAPLGPMLPSMNESSLFDGYAESQRPARPNFEVAAIEAPASVVPVVPPELLLVEIRIPRSFRTAPGPAIPQ
jgi:hypothetical protein